MTRPAQALINLDALRHNYLVARDLHGPRALAVIKANAYGHGAVRCAQALEGIADGFAVAFAAEAFELRAAGIQGPILILEGCFDTEELIEAARLGLWTAVHQESQLQAVEQTPLPVGALHVWLKVDSGMHRAGFELDQVSAAHARLSACPSVASITLMTHFARSDEPETHATQKQIDTFDAATADLPGARSLSNSGGILAWPDSRRDWARAGILLYGADPMPDQAHGLIPVMTLQSQVFAVKTIAPGESLGYGGTFTARVRTRVGLVAMGYADGYPRSAPTGTPIAVDGQMTRTIGRVSMDMLTIDLTDLPQTGIGSKVECWGRQIDINTVARLVGTISYELLCNVKRVPLVYVS
jgi:alanine racemase